MITVGARDSRLSYRQVEEVETLLQQYHPHACFTPTWLTTSGDRDKKTALHDVYNTDFFTKEIDALQLQGGVRISIHSAKDLPDPLAKGLRIAAITSCLDPRDALVLPDGFSIETLPQHAKIGTSSLRRQQAIGTLHPSFKPVSIRGTIEERLQLLQNGVVDGLIIAEAAILRLGLHHLNRCFPMIEPEPLQGMLAVVILEGDDEMFELFSCLDTRVNRRS